jgi:hypothetical protein
MSEEIPNAFSAIDIPKVWRQLTGSIGRAWSRGHRRYTDARVHALRRAQGRMAQRERRPGWYWVCHGTVSGPFTSLSEAALRALSHRDSAGLAHEPLVLDHLGQPPFPGPLAEGAP